MAMINVTPSSLKYDERSIMYFVICPKCGEGMFEICNDIYKMGCNRNFVCSDLKCGFEIECTYKLTKVEVVPK
jgi:predicted RNA-binding Zn-ribbon protein involved in translation (DUF1610 family)